MSFLGIVLKDQDFDWLGCSTKLGVESLSPKYRKQNKIMFCKHTKKEEIIVNKSSSTTAKGHAFFSTLRRLVDYQQCALFIVQEKLSVVLHTKIINVTKYAVGGFNYRSQNTFLHQRA